MDFITAPLVVGICVFGVYKLFELFARRRERLALIDKLTENFSGDKINLTLPDFSQLRFSYGALKVGCLLIGLGIGLLTGFIITINSIPDYVENFRNWEYREIAGMIYGSCVLIFGGIGLLTAFVIELKMEKKQKNK
nr:DUF6249 domain-containing protein [Bacteroides sp. 519]